MKHITDIAKAYDTLVECDEAFEEILGGKFSLKNCKRLRVKIKQLIGGNNVK